MIEICFGSYSVIMMPSEVRHLNFFAADICRYYILLDRGVVSNNQGHTSREATIIDGEVRGIKGAQRHRCKQPRHKEVVERTAGAKDTVTCLVYSHLSTRNK